MPQTLWTWSIAVDWDNDNSFLTANDDITASVINLSITNGMNDDMSLVASVGTLTLTLKNADMKFSPKYASSIYFGKMLPGLPVRVQVTHLGSTYTIFRGYTADFTVTPGAFAERQATITAVDGLERLQAYDRLAIPLQVGIRSDTLVTTIVNAAYVAPAASGTISIDSAVANNDGWSVRYTYAGVSTLNTYTFKTALTPTANEVLIGADIYATAVNFAAALNGASGSGTLYAAGTSNITLGATAEARGESQTCTDSGSTPSPIGNNGGTTFRIAQSFTMARSGTLTQFTFTLEASTGAPSGTITWEIQSDTNGYPSGTVLKTSTVAPTASAVNTVTVSSGPTLTASAKYHLVLYATSAQSAGNYWGWSQNTAGTFPGGNRTFSSDAGATWSAGVNNNDQSFSITTKAEVIVTAIDRGTVGNTLAFVDASAHMSTTGSPSGGLDYPTGLTSYQTGVYTFDYAGDGWETETNALSALQETVNSEQGMFFCQLDGTLTYWNRDEIFKRVTTASSVVLGNSFQSAQGGQLLNDVYNRVEVKYAPRSPLSSGIVAKATNAIQVPGQSGTERWNGTVVLPGGGNVVQKLQAVDPATELPMGIVSVVTPLVSTTDWTANTARDGSGIDYTNFISLSFSVVRHSDSVEVSIKNTALDSLFVTMLKVRGVGVVKYNPVTVTREDATYQSVRGRRTLALELPFGFSGVESYADALAQYWLRRFKDPDYRIKSVSFSNEFQIASTSLFSLQIGSIVTITETQAQISASKHMVIGFNIDLSIERTSNITLNLKKVDDTTYWILEDATYGVLGTTTRLSI